MDEYITTKQYYGTSHSDPTYELFKIDMEQQPYRSLIIMNQPKEE